MQCGEGRSPNTTHRPHQRPASARRLLSETQPNIVLTALLTAFFTFFVPLVLTILVIPSFILRWLVSPWVGLFRRDLDRILTGKDTFFALEAIYDKPRSSILVHCHFEDEVPLEELRRSMEELLIVKDKRGNSVYRRLRQRVARFMGFLFWQWDPEFDIKNHVRFYHDAEPTIAIPSPCTVSELRGISGALLERPLPAHRSPWEVLVFRCVSCPGNKEVTGDSKKTVTVAAFRIHHSLADGQSILKMLLKIAGEENAKIPGPTLPPPTIWQRFALPFIVARSPLDFAKSIQTSSNGRHSWHLLGTKQERNYHVFYSDKIPVDKIKLIKNKYSVGYNEAIYGITAGVVRKMMLAAGQELPNNVSTCFGLPMPNDPGGLFNNMTVLFFKFNPRIADAEERMAQIADTFQEIRSAPTMSITHSLLLDWVFAGPTWVLRPIYDKLMTSVLMDNFPGPESFLNFKAGGGVKITDVTAIMGNLAGYWAASAILLSYAGSQRITFTVDKKIFENHKIPENFSQMVNDEVEALLAAGNDRNLLESTQTLMHVTAARNRAAKLNLSQKS